MRLSRNGGLENGKRKKPGKKRGRPDGRTGSQAYGMNRSAVDRIFLINVEGEEIIVKIDAVGRGKVGINLDVGKSKGDAKSRLTAEEAEGKSHPMPI